MREVAAREVAAQPSRGGARAAASVCECETHWPAADPGLRGSATPRRVPSGVISMALMPP